MKIKPDFITNSSSSTFIVAFIKKIVGFEDVEFKINREAKARQVLKDALAQKPKKINSKNKALIRLVTEELTHGYFGPDYSEFQDAFREREGITEKQLYDNAAWLKSFYEEYENVQQKECGKMAIEFLTQNEGSYLYIFNYGDDDGEFFSEMEHGHTFENLPQLHISKHEGDRMDEFHGDHRRMSRNHPVHIEFVAIPSYFDIHSYLSIREIAGQFMSHDITLESVTLIAEAVKEGPVFTLSSPTGTYCASALFFIEILKQVGLTMKAFSNFLPTDVKSYESILKNSTFKNDDGKPVMDMTVIFINLYKLVEANILAPVIEQIVKVEEYSQDMNDTIMMYKSG